MYKLKVCFVGIGSIAKRHIHNLVEVCEEEKIVLEIDALRYNVSDLPEDISDFIGHVYYDSEDLPRNYDVIFITNPTEFHMDTLKKLHNHARDFFIEKPVTSYKNMEAIEDISYREDSVYYVACPLRYTNVIQYIKDHVNPKDVISVRSISSSYLPDWRPEKDYRGTYSAHKDLGGGVSIDLIHEWDYIQYLFGRPTSIFYTCGTKSKLEIDCEDYAVYVAEYEDKVIELHLDYFGRKTIREVMIFTNDDTILGDLVKSQVTYLREGKVIDLSEERNDFQKKELRHFLHLIRREESNGKDRVNEASGKEWKNNNFIFEAYRTMKYTQGEVE